MRASKKINYNYEYGINKLNDYIINNEPIIFIDEEWKLIEIYRGYEILPWYLISSYGRVFSTVYNKILKQSFDKDGYLNIGLYDINKHQINCRVNRLVALAFKYYDGCDNMVVNHIDGIKINNHVDNLEFCTSSYNRIHAFNNNLVDKNIYIGENNPMNKILTYQAKQICILLEQCNYTINQISKIIGCSYNIVYNIYIRKNWKHISCNYKF